MWIRLLQRYMSSWAGATAASIKPMIQRAAVVTTPALDLPEVAVPTIKAMPADFPEAAAATPPFPHNSWRQGNGFGILGGSSVGSCILPIPSANLTASSSCRSVPLIQSSDAGTGPSHVPDTGTDDQPRPSVLRVIRPGGVEEPPEDDEHSHRVPSRTSCHPIAVTSA